MRSGPSLQSRCLETQLLLTAEAAQATGKTSDCKTSGSFLVLVQGKEQLAFQRLLESGHILD